MDLKQLIETRRTIAKYKSEAVPADVLRSAMELSLWAPNHKLTFPWVYTLVEPGARKQIADLAIELKMKKGPLTPLVEEAIRASILTSPHMLSLGRKRSENPATDKEDYATLACSVQIMSMALWEKGVGSKWSTSGYSVHTKTYEILGLDPNVVQLEGCLFIGYPAEVPISRGRPSLDSVLRVK